MLTARRTDFGKFSEYRLITNCARDFVLQTLLALICWSFHSYSSAVVSLLLCPSLPGWFSKKLYFLTQNIGAVVVVIIVDVLDRMIDIVVTSIC